MNATSSWHDAQRTAITAEVARKREQLRLATEETKEAVARGISEAQRQTLAVETTLEEARRTLALGRATAKAESLEAEALGRARAAARALEVTSTAKSQARERRAAVERQQLEARRALRADRPACPSTPGLDGKGGPKVCHRS